VNRDELKPNGYNPNAVAPPEMELLKISILEDGWTQPIVANRDNTIVDGFHRWTVSKDKEVFALTGGMVPVVYIDPPDESSKRMATIRHNRARGTHAVMRMADIVEGMLMEGMAMEEICKRLQMETEEVIRLANRKGIPKTEIIMDAAWSKSWNPE
jgi:ParB-like chromosome segregation protein Spo0J